MSTTAFMSHNHAYHQESYTCPKCEKLLIQEQVLTTINICQLTSDKLLSSYLGFVCLLLHKLTSDVLIKISIGTIFA